MLQDAQHRLRIGCALYHTVVNTFVQLRLDVLTGNSRFFIVDIVIIVFCLKMGVKVISTSIWLQKTWLVSNIHGFCPRFLQISFYQSLYLSKSFFLGLCYQSDVLPLFWKYLLAQNDGLKFLYRYVSSSVKFNELNGDVNCQVLLMFSECMIHFIT